MKLRHHSLMTRKSGFVSWPPRWQPVDPHRSEVQGEVGILDDASMNDLITNKIFVAMVHLKERHTAVLAFDDEMFTNQLYRLFEKNIGRPIQEIGDLDLPT